MREECQTAVRKCVRQLEGDTVRQLEGDIVSQLERRVLDSWRG